MANPDERLPSVWLRKPTVVFLLIVGALGALYLITRAGYGLSAKWSAGSIELSPASTPARR